MKQDKGNSNTDQCEAVSDENEGMIDLTAHAVESFDATKHRQRSLRSLEQSWPWYRDFVKSLAKLIQVPSDTINNYVRTIGFLILLGLLFPVNLLITLLTLITWKLRADHRTPNSNSKRILVSGGMMTKALQICRAFHQDGHRVILVDDVINKLTGFQWSNSVERFYVVPSPSEQPDEYIDALVNIVRKENIDVFVPVTGPYHAHIDAQTIEPLAKIGCTTISMSVDEVALLDNKFTFTDKAQALGLPVPKSVYITSRKQLLDFDFDQTTRPYICKSIMYDWLDRGTMTKLPLPTRTETIEYINRLPISEDCPYILQEYIEGDEYCTHGTCLDGKLTLFTCCHSSAWQLNYKHVEHPAILEWCTRYVKDLKLTGHASFDFIVGHDDGKAYGIECNPRAHSAISAFYNQSHVADAYFRPGPSKPIIPHSTARETYWITHELWRILSNIRSIDKVSQSFKRILNGREAIWSWDDPLPYLLHYHVHIVYLLLDNLRPSRVRFFQKIDCCIGELS